MNKLGLTLGVLALLVAWPARAELPKDLDECKSRQAELGKTPEGAAKVWFDACYVYMNEDTRDEGRKMLQYLTIPFKDNPNWDKDRSQEYFLRALLKDQYIMRSYAKGTSPENQYKMDPNDYELNVERVNLNPPGRESRGIQVYVKSSGADMPRPLYFKQSTSTKLWYMNAHTNVYTGIRPPKEGNQEEFD